MGQMSQGNQCCYCKKPIQNPNLSFCGEYCSEKFEQMRLAAAAAAAGRFCKKCKVPVIEEGKDYCSAVCETLAKQKVTRCPICMKQFVVTKSSHVTCSQECTQKMQTKRRDAILVRRWLEKRSYIADLNVGQMLTSLFTLNTKTASGFPVARRIWVNKVSEFPVDPDVKSILWKEDGEVYCIARKPQDAIIPLTTLKKIDYELLQGRKIVRNDEILRLSAAAREFRRSGS